MATVDPIGDLTGLNRAERLATLRRSMAAIPGHADHAPADLGDAMPFTTEKTNAPEMIPAGGRALSGPVCSRTLRSIPTPTPLSELLPYGALARGTVLAITGAGSILVGLVASASAAGRHVALIGQPKLGLLAVHEQGGDLSKVHLIDPGRADPLDAASICIEGLDLIVTTVYGRDVPPTRARALLARNRTHAGVFAITDGRMPGLDLTITSKPVGYADIEQGRGRIRSITIETTVEGRGITERTGRHTLSAPTIGQDGLRWTSVNVDAAGGHLPHRLVAAQ